MNWRVFNGKIGENYAWDLEFLYKYRDFSDGIDFLELKSSWDRYACDHKPSFEISFKIFNFIVAELTIYNIWHVDNPKSPFYEGEKPDYAIDRMNDDGPNYDIDNGDER